MLVILHKNVANGASDLKALVALSATGAAYLIPVNFKNPLQQAGEIAARYADSVWCYIKP